MENTLNIIGKETKLPTTKTEQQSFITNMVEQAVNGEVDLLKVLAAFENLKAVIEGYLKDPRVKALEIEEVRKYEREIAEVHNAKFEIASVGVKYDYSECGHLAYNALCAKIDEMGERKKKLEEEMKLHMNDSYVYTDKETGESYEVFPPKKSGSTSVKITIKK